MSCAVAQQCTWYILLQVCDITFQMINQKINAQMYLTQTLGSNVAKNLTKGWNSSAASSYSMKSGWREWGKNMYNITALSPLIYCEPVHHDLGLTRGFLALKIADQLDDLIHVVETLQLTLVVNDLHWVFNHLTSRKIKMHMQKRCWVSLSC